jgi:hypothetical protein
MDNKGVERYVPTDDDLDLLPESLRDGVEQGRYYLQHPQTWYSPSRPVIKDVTTGRLVKGSGKIAGSKEAAVASRQTSYKRTKAYNEALEELIPIDRGDSPNAVASLRELTDSFWKAVNGQDVQVTCPHCEGKFMAPIKSDPHAIMKMIERLTGRAKETQEVNIHSEQISMVLNERTPMREIDVITIDPYEEQRRRDALERP